MLKEDKTIRKDVMISRLLRQGNIIADVNTGEIFSCGFIRKHMPIKLDGHINQNGYMVYMLSYKGKQLLCLGHRIIWIAANGVPKKEDLVVDHINNNKSDNRINNLQLLTFKENINKAVGDKLVGKKTYEISPVYYDEIREVYRTTKTSVRRLAAVYGISKSRMGEILTHKKCVC